MMPDAKKRRLLPPFLICPVMRARSALLPPGRGRSSRHNPSGKRRGFARQPLLSRRQRAGVSLIRFPVSLKSGNITSRITLTFTLCRAGLSRKALRPSRRIPRRAGEALPPFPRPVWTKGGRLPCRPQKKRAFPFPKAPFSLPEMPRLRGKTRPDMTSATHSPLCTHRGKAVPFRGVLTGMPRSRAACTKKPSQSGAFPLSFPRRTAFAVKTRAGTALCPPFAQGRFLPRALTRTSDRPARRRRRRFSPPACIPPAHGPSGCRR